MFKLLYIVNKKMNTNFVAVILLYIYISNDVRYICEALILVIIAIICIEGNEEKGY